MRWRERPFLDLLPPPHMILMSPYRREIFHIPPPLFPGSFLILPPQLPSSYLGDPIFVERCHNIVVQLAVLRPQVLCLLHHSDAAVVVTIVHELIAVRNQDADVE